MSFWDVFCHLCAKESKKPNTVCRELKFSNATATKWKSGSVPRGDTLSRIAEYFNVSTDFLINGEEREMPPQNTMREQIIAQFETLPEDKQKEAINYLSFLNSQVQKGE